MKVEVNHFGKNIFTAQIEDFNILEGTPIVIGRSEKCHIHLDDQTLSRKHAQIIYEQGDLYVESLSEYKKIELNGNQVLKSKVSLQDKISINDFVLKITSWDYQNNRRQDIETSPVPDENLTEIISDKTELLVDDATQILEEDDLPSVDDVERVESLEEESESLDPVEDTIDEEEDLNAPSFDSTESFQADGPESEESTEGDAFSEDGFGDDSFGDDSFGSDDGFGGSDEDSTKVFQNFADYTLVLSGDLAPFDKYKIEDNEVFIGRNEDKCQIILNDPEVSGIHAMIKKTLISLTIEDKDSSNGTLVNGERINKHELQKGDIVSIGSTTLKVEVRSELIESEQDMLMPVDDDQEVEIEEIIEEEVDFGADGGFGEPVKQEKGLKAIWKDPARRKKMIYILVGFMLLYIMLDDGETPEDPVNNAKPKAENSKEANTKNKEKIPLNKKHSPETLERLEENYTLALAKYEAGEYYEAKEYLDIVYNIDSEYKDVKTLLELVKQGYEELLRLKAAEEAEKERKKRQLQVKKLMTKTVKAVKERNIKVAESLFAQVLEIDPENIDIPQLKIEIEAYKEKQAQIKLEKERAKAKRQKMVDALAPGKNLFLKQKWYLAIGKLENFNKLKAMDEDLIEEATKMLKEAKIKLDAIVSPLIAKARSYKEGQDYKRAYETYGEVLKFNPASEEALNERDSILDRLDNNSKKIYREALISESLSLFSEAKEKFQQVQQISPINSEYYIKATEKLKDYLE